MLAGHSHKLLEAAAAESLHRIQRDREKAPQRLKPLLAYIEENLFDPTLDVNQLKRSCGVRDNSVPIQFHSAVGRPPHGYIEDRRLETACRLLAGTNLKIWQISELLGYSSIQVFSRAFSRWSSQRPTSFRKKARLRESGSSVAATDAGGDWSLARGTEMLRKALSGELSNRDAGQLIEQLLRLYPSCQISRERTLREPSEQRQTKNEGNGQSAGDQKQAPGDAGGPLTASDMWRKMEGMEPEDRRQFLDHLELDTPALFHFLRTKSRELGRESPRDGVELADLALHSLSRLTRTRGDEKLYSDLKARGLARLANAHSRARDFQEAEKAFIEAERTLEGGSRDLSIEAEVLILKSSLRRDQRRFLEARDLLERASDLARNAHDKTQDLPLRVLIAQSSVAFEEGETDSAISLLEEALPLMSDDTEDVLKLALYHNLVATYTDAGRYQEAFKMLPVARRLSHEHGKKHDQGRFRWLEGLIARGLEELEKAETALTAARDSFSEIDHAIDATLVCLDLAEVYLRQERYSDLIALCQSMTPLHGMLRDHHEATVALQMFQQAAEEKSVTHMVLDQARRSLPHNQNRHQMAF